MNTFQQLGIDTVAKGFTGRQIEMQDVFNNNIIVHAFRIENSKYPRRPGEKCVYMQIEVDGAKRVLFTTSVVLMNSLQQVGPAAFPVRTRIIKKDKRFEFTEPSK